MNPPSESGKPVNHRDERAKSRRRGNSGGPRPSQPRAAQEPARAADRLVQTPRRAAVNNKATGGQPDPMKTSLGYIGADSWIAAGQRRGGNAQRPKRTKGRKP